MNIIYEKVELKYQKLINKARDYMKDVKDYEHDINHLDDVIFFTKKLLDTLDINISIDVCLIASYWHDVGRIKKNKGHEKISAEMLKEAMLELGYQEDFIQNCYDAIINHGWSMMPTTNEGWVVKDADKLAWLGFGRWSSCLEHNQKLDEIIHLLPRLRSEFLHFDVSKKIYDESIIELIKYLSQRLYNKDNTK